ncbi:MAG: polysaccharide deacetylase family protein, partial [Candidatus Omnitrophica bacterium]|nr:polysaccharide deacetylase family protein [Candidatus Omnitrophota bacterium]
MSAGMRVVALTFHDIIGDDSLAASPHEGFYRITTRELETLLSELRHRGYQTVSSKHFRAWQQGQGTLPERAVALTFDDGYAGHFELAVPLLIRYRFTGTFFVTVERVGQPGYLSWEQLRRCVFLGMEIGAHGMTHRPLTSLSRVELHDELAHAKRILEERLGVPIRALAAPGGFWNGAVTDAAKRAGYDMAWISTIGTNGKETNPLGLRRVVVRRPFSADRIVSLVEGWRPAF